MPSFFAVSRNHALRESATSRESSTRVAPRYGTDAVTTLELHAAQGLNRRDGRAFAMQKVVGSSPIIRWKAVQTG